MLEVKALHPPLSLLEWLRLSDQKQIDMSPPYQRKGDLWPVRYQRLLINSILNRLDIPKIYFADFTYHDTPLKRNRSLYAIVDGKQRMGSFFRFLRGDLKLDDEVVYTDEGALTLEGKSYYDLLNGSPAQQELARLIENYVPTAMSVLADEPGEIEDLFVRLNLNVSISGPEKRNAMRGPVPGKIRNVAEHGFFTTYVSFSTDRGQDLNMAAKMLKLELDGAFASYKKSDLDRLVTDHEDQPGTFMEVEVAEVNKKLDRLCRVFGPKDKLLSRQGAIIPYYALISQVPDRQLDRIRSFLQSFEEARSFELAQQRARSAGSTSSPPLDQRIADYNQALRSPDDKSRLKAMVDTLHTYFEKDWAFTKRP